MNRWPCHAHPRRDLHRPVDRCPLQRPGRAGADGRGLRAGLPRQAPGRALVTLAAILLVAIAVTFGVGLATSLGRVGTDVLKTGYLGFGLP
jgi:hypothetical protein